MHSMLDPKKLVYLLKRNLHVLNIDYERNIAEFGQVRASEERVDGKEFSMIEHTKALVLALLSNQRPWKRIADNLDNLDKIFFSFDPQKIEATAPNLFIDELKKISCGNRSIKSQMNSLKVNIKKLKLIEAQFGAMDHFVTSRPANDVAKALSDPNSPYKLEQLGFTLAVEYLKNVGIRAGKPDVHMRRILSSERLGFTIGYPSEEEAFNQLGILASRAEVNEIYFDNLLWLFCAINYGNVCSATPGCDLCLLAGNCNYPKVK